MKFKCRKCGTIFEARLTAHCPNCDEAMDLEPLYDRKIAKPS
jgi:rubrerythrin